ncbi:MAG: HipA domain-containing protein [Ruminococcus sp.]|nr:HipA domain-containing protein [Ruminococcus sp.]
MLNQNILPSLSNWKHDPFADYGGLDRKDGLVNPDGQRYMVKYSEKHSRINNFDTSYVNNVVSEYVSSHILDILGFPVHETFLAARNGELLVACKNFCTESSKLIEFSRYLRKYYDSGNVGRLPSLSQLNFILSNDTDLSPHTDEFQIAYWERFVGDALVANFDRHMGNWGYMVSENGVSAAPIYDNGSTLFPALSEEGMSEVLQSEKGLLKRVFLFPKAALLVNGQKASYSDMLTSGYNKYLNEAVLKIVPKIEEKMPDVIEFIGEQDFFSDTRKSFYSTIIQKRFELLLKPSLNICRNRNYDLNALERLEHGISYREDDFEKSWESVNAKVKNMSADELLAYFGKGGFDDDSLSDDDFQGYGRR